MRYYSIRVVHADNEDDALTQVEDGNFDEAHPLCDQVFSFSYLQFLLKTLPKYDQ